MRQGGRPIGAGAAAMIAALWVLMMLVWLGGLLAGVWWVWPLFQAPALGFDRVAAGMWLIIGFAAWVVALNLGWQRYWRR
jgi:hypothetical protein